MKNTFDKINIVLLIGISGAGKTCFAAEIIGKNFEVNKREHYFLMKEKEKIEIKEKLALVVKQHNQEERYLKYIEKQEK